MHKSRRVIKRSLGLVSMLMPHLEMKMKMILDRISTNDQTFSSPMQLPIEL